MTEPGSLGCLPRGGVIRLSCQVSGDWLTRFRCAEWVGWADCSITGHLEGQVAFSHSSHRGSQARSHPSLGPCVRMHSVKVLGAAALKGS